MSNEYRAEKWTDVSGVNGRHELWAVIMADDQPCAFGSQQFCEKTAEIYNEKYGEAKP